MQKRLEWSEEAKPETEKGGRGGNRKSWISSGPVVCVPSLYLNAIWHALASTCSFCIHSRAKFIPLEGKAYSRRWGEKVVDTKAAACWGAKNTEGAPCKKAGSQHSKGIFPRP